LRIKFYPHITNVLRIVSKSSVAVGNCLSL